jgi:hypothetical protein
MFRNTLLYQLSKRMGLNLDTLIARGLMPEQVAAQMADKCTACPDPAGCQAFLDKSPEKITAPPSHCVNIRLLTFLNKSLPPQK